MFTTARVLKQAFERLDSELKLHHYKIRNFRPNVSFAFERGSYVVKIAENGAELEECLKLRFDVFHREYKNKKRTTGVDIDYLDEGCDHLLIFDKNGERVVGTYRLNSSLFSDRFYSAGEFEIEKILEVPGPKLELGRACIDKEHRNGAVIALLWRGIAEYIQKTGTKVLFGCASVKTIQPMEIGLIMKHLVEKGHVTDEYGVAPTRKYQVRQLAKVLDYLETHAFEYVPDEIETRIPTLFKSYLKAGVKVCGEPAIDHDFRCVDFLVVMKMDEMNPLLKGKYRL